MEKIRKSFEEKTKKYEKTFFSCGKTTVNSLRKKTRTRKTQIALFLAHAPGFRSARENACPTGGGVYCNIFKNTLRPAELSAVL